MKRIILCFLFVSITCFGQKVQNTFIVESFPSIVCKNFIRKYKRYEYNGRSIILSPRSRMEEKRRIRLGTKIIILSKRAICRMDKRLKAIDIKTLRKEYYSGALDGFEQIFYLNINGSQKVIYIENVKVVKLNNLLIEMNKYLEEKDRIEVFHR